ncbi:MAG: hydantoinase B/oxoprolinase family protein [Dehalococcoidia bacterium]|jgi:N-methylhydantoinase B|nr:hydantoinase B/oxoprolinase family protein [Dehalococcoidia bacterium]MDP7082887.1 hydantoinase B/oxoprolinase family protein [Dehalococcoidia bacterium]MDP7200118.1 hydantoinase B/oxoprolinase family protein [Dehalococcoidia bacterium]MDP7511660.1 hydantoinase B/oxoprolinase family protein [Dehalococcoidia bacterium]HJN86666.1 hydantoinase B/oxoprolinase family protein [Dehalococcoidia bacterium]
MRQGTDPVTREIIKNALMGAADTMALTVVRTARSAVIKDGMDFSTALFTAGGQQVAQGLTLPAHLGSMAPALEGVRNAFGDDVHPGDVFANNDPYEGGSHLPDIFLFKPIFVHDTHIGWSCCIGHQTDIGGRVAGGNACDNTEIYQEGLLIPPIKLYEAGVLNRAVWRILEKNVRVPEKVLGDVQALLAAVRFGERDLLRLVDEYGLEELKGYMADILDTTEQLTRAEFAALPHGEWEFTDYIDNDGIDLRPIAIHAKVKIEGDEVFVDFAGTSPQAKGSINPNFAYTKSQVYAVMKCLIDPAIQSNSGFFRPFHITAPEGCFVNPQHPAPVAARGLAGFRICHALFGAMAQALPGKVPGAWGGGEVGLSFGGYHPDRKAWVYLEFNNDGPRGGGPYIDGADGLAAPIHNMANTPIESIEADQPLLVEQFGLVADTGGAGKYRGGLGIVRQFRVLAEEATFQLRSDRTDFLPWGAEGGKPGTPTKNYLNPDTENRELPGKHLMTLKKGDVYRLIQAGAGGYGDPLDRDAAAVLEDVRQEKLTVDHVRREYGVVVSPDKLELDQEATEELRAKMRAGETD